MGCDVKETACRIIVRLTMSSSDGMAHPTGIEAVSCSRVATMCGPETGGGNVRPVGSYC